MEVKLICFGRIAEIIENKNMEISGITETDEFKIHIEGLYPALKTMKYKIAVNQELIQQNTPIPNNAIVALMPPFSGG